MLVAKKLLDFKSQPAPQLKVSAKAFYGFFDILLKIKKYYH